jgi:hypothetical protein
MKDVKIPSEYFLETLHFYVAGVAHSVMDLHLHLDSMRRADTQERKDLYGSLASSAAQRAASYYHLITDCISLEFYSK